MIKANINSGVCGFITTVQAETGDKYQTKVKIESTCPHVAKMAEALETVNAMNELFKKGQSQILTESQTLPHITCPVPTGLLKAIEASSGLALPKDASITFIKE